MSINEDLIRRYPELKIKILTGSDSGTTKKEYFEDINLTLQACIIFIFSPVIQSGVDITIPMKMVYGVLSGLSNSQRALCK